MHMAQDKICVLLGNCLEDFCTGKDVQDTGCPSCFSIGRDRQVHVCFRGIHPGRFSRRQKGGLHGFYPLSWHYVLMHSVVKSTCLFSKEKKNTSLFFFFLCWKNGLQQEMRDPELDRGPGLGCGFGGLAAQLWYWGHHSNVKFQLQVQGRDKERFMQFCLLSSLLYFSIIYIYA